MSSTSAMRTHVTGSGPLPWLLPTTPVDSQPRRHRRRAGLPLLDGATAVGRLGLGQGPAYARMGQTEIVVTVEHGHLLPQPVFALAQRADPSPDRGHMLPDGEIDPLHEGRVDVPPKWGQHVIDGLQGTKHHAVLHVDQAPAPHPLDDLGVEELWPWHPAGLGGWPWGLATWRLDPVPIVGQ